MNNSLFYVDVNYGDNTGIKTKSGYVEAATSGDAILWATDKVRNYPGTQKIWDTICYNTDSNSYDEFKFEQASDHWDEPDEISE